MAGREMFKFFTEEARSHLFHHDNPQGQEGHGQGQGQSGGGTSATPHAGEHAATGGEGGEKHGTGERAFDFVVGGIGDRFFGKEKPGQAHGHGHEETHSKDTGHQVSTTSSSDPKPSSSPAPSPASVPIPASTPSPSPSPAHLSHPSVPANPPGSATTTIHAPISAESATISTSAPRHVPEEQPHPHPHPQRQRQEESVEHPASHRSDTATGSTTAPVRIEEDSEGRSYTPVHPERQPQESISHPSSSAAVSTPRPAPPRVSEERERERSHSERREGRDSGSYFPEHPPSQTHASNPNPNPNPNPVHASASASSPSHLHPSHAQSLPSASGSASTANPSHQPSRSASHPTHAPAPAPAPTSASSHLHPSHAQSLPSPTSRPLPPSRGEEAYLIAAEEVRAQLGESGIFESKNHEAAFGLLTSGLKDVIFRERRGEARRGGGGGASGSGGGEHAHERSATAPAPSGEHQHLQAPQSPHSPTNPNHPPSRGEEAYQIAAEEFKAQLGSAGLGILDSPNHEAAFGLLTSGLKDVIFRERKGEPRRGVSAPGGSGSGGGEGRGREDGQRAHTQDPHHLEPRSQSPNPNHPPSRGEEAYKIAIEEARAQFGSTGILDTETHQAAFGLLTGGLKDVFFRAKGKGKGKEKETERGHDGEEEVCVSFDCGVYEWRLMVFSR